MTERRKPRSYHPLYKFIYIAIGISSLCTDNVFNPAGIGFRCLRINACCDKLLGKEAMSHRLFRPLPGLRRSGVKNNLHPS